MANAGERYARALDGFDAVIRAVPADRWASPSPCTGWTARDVAGHVITNQRMAVAMAGKGDQPERTDPPGDALGDDPLADWEAASGASRAAVADEEALEREVKTPFGMMPLGSFLEIFVTDVVAHTWDLGKATGQDVLLDPELMQRIHARLRPISEALRKPGLFDPEVDTGDDADDQTRFLAFLGRSG